MAFTKSEKINYMIGLIVVMLLVGLHVVSNTHLIQLESRDTTTLRIRLSLSPLPCLSSCFSPLPINSTKLESSCSWLSLDWPSSPTLQAYLFSSLQIAWKCCSIWMSSTWSSRSESACCLLSQFTKCPSLEIFTSIRSIRVQKWQMIPGTLMDSTPFGKFWSLIQF